MKRTETCCIAMWGSVNVCSMWLFKKKLDVFENGILRRIFKLKRRGKQMRLESELYPEELHN